MTTARKGGQFKPGQSGNPAGRPAGSGWSARAREQMQKEWPALRKVLVTKAKSGDMAALRIIAERICPPLRAMDAPVALQLPDGPLSDQGAAILKAVAAGEVPVVQGAQLLGAITALAKVHELDEVLRRLEALEKAQGKTT